MAGIATATVAQIEDCRRRVVQLEMVLQQFSQGTKAPTALGAAEITAIDALVDQVAAALALINT